MSVPLLLFSRLLALLFESAVLMKDDALVGVALPRDASLGKPLSLKMAPK